MVEAGIMSSDVATSGQNRGSGPGTQTSSPDPNVRNGSRMRMSRDRVSIDVRLSDARSNTFKFDTEDLNDNRSQTISVNDGVSNVSGRQRQGSSPVSPYSRR